MTHLFELQGVRVRVSIEEGVGDQDMLSVKGGLPATCRSSCICSA